MSDYTKKVKQHRAGTVSDDRYRLQPSDFDNPLDYWEWRAGEPDFDAIEAAEEDGIACVEANRGRS
ncbi:MAG: hypothetical protein Devi2KO_00870 [Devosia indica]